MKRRDYLRNIGGTAVLPILADRAESAELPDIDDFQWLQSVKAGEQILRVETTNPVDSVDISRYEFGELSSQPTCKSEDDTTHALVWYSATTVAGLHSLALVRNGQTVNEVLVNFDINAITRHIEAKENTGRVAVRQKGQGNVAAYSGCVVTGNQQQPDFGDVADWQNRHHEQLSEEYTVYLQARVTDKALSRMRAHQTVSVWLRSETDAWYPATVDLTDEGYDPTEVYDVFGVRRY